MGHSSNLSQNSISKLERGVCQVDTQEKAEIAKSLGVLAYTEPAVLAVLNDSNDWIAQRCRACK